LERNLGWQYLYAPGFRRLRQIIDADTDVVHVHSLWGSSGYADVGELPALSRKFPIILTLHEQWLTTGHCACPFDCERWKTGCGKCPDLSLVPSVSRDGTRFNWLRRFVALRRSHLRVTTVSDWLRKTVEQSPIFAGKKISVVHNGIDESVFVPGSKQAARAALGLPPDRFVVLLAGQSIEGINQAVAQQGVLALNQLKEDRLMALLVGRSAHLVSRNLSVPCKVLPFQNRPEDLARCYQAADITLVSSEYETFGRIAAESQLCGTPVVTFDTGGLSEVVKDRVGGIVVPKRNVEALREAIKFLYDNGAEAERMGRDGSAWARAQFGGRKIAGDYLALYHEILHHRNKDA
jgi:glycosyltransferase involved in cell wall biosynthesis